MVGIASYSRVLMLSAIEKGRLEDKAMLGFSAANHCSSHGDHGHESLHNYRPAYFLICLQKVGLICANPQGPISGGLHSAAILTSLQEQTGVYKMWSIA